MEKIYDRVDLHYSDEELVEQYDLLNSRGSDQEFYLGYPEGEALRVLDVGCGTGRLAVEFSNAGHKVTGVDPAATMIEYAIRRDGGRSVDWYCSKLSQLENLPEFDLIIMTGHAFQCLLRDEEIMQLFRSVRMLLGKNGRFVFETRNPAFREWTRWNPVDSLVKLVAVDGDSFEMFHKVDSVDEKYVEFRTLYNFGHGRREIVSLSKLRFTTTEELTVLFDVAGLIVCDIYGDWDKSRLSEKSPEIICSLRKS